MAMLCRCLSTCNKTQEKLQTAADVLNDPLKRFGLVISIEKTKTMILNFKGKKEDHPKHLITCDKIERAHIQFMRRMVRGGMVRTSSKKEIDLAKSKNDIDRINWALKYTNEKI